MARINIEDSIYRDPRFVNLIVRMGGDMDRALGAMVRTWDLAQRWYLTSEKMIPISEWKKHMIPDAVLEAGLAEVIGEKIRVRGADEQFEWLRQKVEAGKKGGQARAKGARKNKGESGKRPLAHASGIKHDQASSSPSSSPSSNSFSSSEEKGASPEATAPTLFGNELPAIQGQLPAVPQFIAAYVIAYKTRYPTSRPDVAGKVQGQIKSFLKDRPTQRAINMIQVYCQMDDPWFITKCHDFPTFAENLNKVSLALDTGEMPGKPKRRPIAELLAEEELKRANA